MPFIDFNSRKKVQLFEGITASLFHSEQLTFAHVTLQKGAVVAEHSHVHEQWTHVIEGDMKFRLGDEEKVLTKGMTAFIPGNTIHSAVALTECKVIDCFMPVRQDFVELEMNTK